MNPTALIADDEPRLAEHLRQRLAVVWPELRVLALAENGVDAAAKIEALAPDIVFLDIRMPVLSGLDVARRLDHRCRLVFVTAYDQYAVDAFEREAVDFLLKPVSDERLATTVARLQRRLAAEEPAAGVDELLAKLAQVLPGAARADPLRWIRAPLGKGVRPIAVEEVCYFQASDKYTRVLTEDSESLIRVGIRELSEQLDPQLFWQIHRGTIVNAREIARTSRDFRGRVMVHLKRRPEALEVSRAYAHLFRQM